MKHPILYFTPILLSISPLDVKSEDVLELSPTIVVATKTQKDIQEVMPSTGFISGNELNGRQLNELESALQYLPRVSITHTGHK